MKVKGWLSDEELQQLRKAAEEGTLEDELNPLSIFCNTRAKLLGKIVKGEINAVQLAMLELADLGLNPEGQWIGHEKAQALYGLKKQKYSKGKRRGL